MGQQTIMQSMNKSYSIDENDIDRRFPNELKFKQQLKQGMLSQTAIVSYGKYLFVIRAFPKSLFTSEEPELYKEALNRYREIQKLILIEPNKNLPPLLHITPIIDVIEVSNTIFTLRQYYYYNLKERMYKLPYLTYIEKLWIIFQLLFAVSELHQRNIIHGDIKLENIMLTSNSSVFLTDIASYKPAIIPQDNTTYYTYYFGSGKQSHKTCNVAPERFVEKKDFINSPKDLLKGKQPSIDVFSLGCVIAELLLEEYLFDYEKLMEYKNNKVEITTTLSRIQNKDLQDLITKMLEKDPSKRITLSECLRIFSHNICPIAIPRALIHFNTLITKTQNLNPDMIIGCVYKHWRQIWKLCYGEFNENKIPKLYNKYNLKLINEHSNKQFFNNLTTHFENTFPFNQFEFIFDLDSQCSRLKNEDTYKDDNDNNMQLFTMNNNDKTAILFMNYILQNLPFASYESTKLVGMEMLKCFSNKLTDVEKIQIIVPYFKPMLTNEKYLTRFIALHYLIDILQTIDFKNLIVSPLDYKFFHNYLSPAIFILAEKSPSKQLVILFISLLDRIIDLEQKFRDVERRSRLEDVEKRRNTTIERVDSVNIDGDSLINVSVDQTISQRYTMQVDHKKNILERNEIDKVCDTLVKDFKSRLFSIIQNLFNLQEDIDMLQLLIGKLPTLLSYYSSDKADEIFCFCINILNKKEWILIREILKVFPDMLDRFDQNKNYRTDLINCIEMILSQNINEHVIYELIQVLINLFATKQKSALSINTFLPLFSQLLPFQIHPNTRIRDDINEFTIDFISQLNPIEAFIYTYDIFKPFLEGRVAFITKESIHKYRKPHICRILYEIYLGNFYVKNKPLQLDHEMQGALKFLLEAKKMSSQMNAALFIDKSDSQIKSDDIIDPDNYYFNETQYKQKNQTKCKRYPTINNIIKLSNLYKQDEDEDLKFFVLKILGMCEASYNTELPKYTNNTDLTFEKDMGFGSNDFQLLLFVKKFNISIKLSVVDGMFENEKESEQQSNRYTNISHLSYQSSKSYANWRPQGRLITTIQAHRTTPVEKVISIDENSFVSIDSKGNANAWRVSIDDDNIIQITREWEVINQDYPITFNSTISSGDKNQIVFGSRNRLVKYSQENTNEGKTEVLVKTSNDNNYITSTCTFEKSTTAKLNVLFSTVDCKLHIYDQRMEKLALTCELPKERGIVSCMSRGFDQQTMNIGTLNGYVMKYDARLNSLAYSMKYQDNKPIIGISSYLPNTKQYTKPQIINSKHLIIWTGSDEHDIAMWDTNSFRHNTITPSIIFRSNILYPNQRNINIDLLEIPEMTKINDIVSPSSIEAGIIGNLKQLSAHSWIKYNNNEYRKLIMHTIQSDFYERSEHSVWNSQNIYNNIYTPQSVFSPYITPQLHNPSYILSAGNDKTIRYWDISKEWLCNETKKKGVNEQFIGSYVVNAPCLIKGCRFTKTECDGTFVVRSHEMYFEENKIKDTHFSEGLMMNGETRPTIDTTARIADAAHQNVITSILPLSVRNEENVLTNLLVSSSWDGSVKIWK